jgi:hypothetical protein
LRWGLPNFLPRLALNLYPPNLPFLSTWDYRCEPLLPASYNFFFYNALYFTNTIIISLFSETILEKTHSN